MLIASKGLLVLASPVKSMQVTVVNWPRILTTSAGVLGAEIIAAETREEVVTDDASKPGRPGRRPRTGRVDAQIVTLVVIEYRGTVLPEGSD